MREYKQICIGGPLHGHRLTPDQERQGHKSGVIAFPYRCPSDDHMVRFITQTETDPDTVPPLPMPSSFHEGYYHAKQYHFGAAPLTFWIWERIRDNPDQEVIDFILFALEK